MLCKDAEELIKNYKTGSITADNFLLLIQHTKECPKCKALFDSVESSSAQGDENDVTLAIKRIFQRYQKFIKKKKQENRFYTKKTFYIILNILFILFAVVGVLNDFSFNNFYMSINLFMLATTLLTTVMLLVVED